VIECGGDTDTVGDNAGALAGASAGEAGIPAYCLSGIRDLPINPALLRQTARRLRRIHASGQANLLRYCWLLALPRNLFFLAVVLFHGFRRLLPPY
jgi:hypothetical protein